MNASNFSFLKSSHHDLFELAHYAEQYVFSDPSSTCVKLRTYGEVLVHYIYPKLGLSFSEGTSFGELLYNPEFKEIIQPEIVKTLHCLRMLGNKGAHPGAHISIAEALLVLKSAYDLGAWLAFLENVHESIPPYVEPRNPEIVLTETQLKTQLEQAIREQATLEQASFLVSHSISCAEKTHFQESSRIALSKVDLEIDHLVDILDSTDLRSELRDIAAVSEKSLLLSSFIVGCILLGIVFFGLRALSVDSPPKPSYSISAIEADHYIGKDVSVCGKVVQISSYKEWTFLNFEQKYPHMPLVAVISDANLHQFPAFSSYLDKKLCLRGILSSYRGKNGNTVASMPLKDKSQVSIAK